MTDIDFQFHFLPSDLHLRTIKKEHFTNFSDTLIPKFTEIYTTTDFGN